MSNFKNYRSYMQIYEPPVIPFIAISLTDLTFIDENPDRVRRKTVELACPSSPRASSTVLSPRHNDTHSPVSTPEFPSSHSSPPSDSPPSANGDALLSPTNTPNSTPVGTSPTSAPTLLQGQPATPLSPHGLALRLSSLIPSSPRGIIPLLSPRVSATPPPPPPQPVAGQQTQIHTYEYSDYIIFYCNS